jgi:hypothetical protein
MRLNWRILSLSQCALTSGCSLSASAVALMPMSLNDALYSSPISDSCSRISVARVTSNSAVRKKVGTGPFDSASRRAMVFLICVSGMSLKSPSVARRSAAAERAARPPAAFAFSMSRLTTRPPGPEPWTAPSSMLRSDASLRASGEER